MDTHFIFILLTLIAIHGITNGESGACLTDVDCNDAQLKCISNFCQKKVVPMPDFKLHPKKDPDQIIDLSELSEDSKTVSISSSCNDKEEDGLYYIKPTSDGEIIPVICQGGYTMLDASLNFDSISSYFTSMYQYGGVDKYMYGTDCSDTGGWRDWFIPANDNTKFRVALDCVECKTGGMYGDNTGYYMTNGYFCPVMLDIDGCSADKDMTGQTKPDVMCSICDDQDGLCGTGEGRDGDTIYDKDASPSWCDCYTLQLSADHMTTDKHKQYCQQDLNWRPNLVIDRSQCTCYKPAEAENTIYTNIKLTELPIVSAEYREEILDPDNKGNFIVSELIQWDDDDLQDEIDSTFGCNKKIIELTNEDFKYGTYRITECGNYVLTEDILIHFNKPSHKFNYEEGDSPNAYDLDDLYWYPTNEQQNSGQYFGLNAFWGPYSIGFPAAITVESNHVYIDLNGFEIAMDPEYYLQQRFFALILLSSKPFEAKQGPVDFGRDDQCSRDITIKDGTLGLSSHHGIMGSCAQNVAIYNLKIYNFDTTGIQCNGCKYVDIEDVKIGPQNTNIPVKGRYTHGRIILSRLRYFVEEYGDRELRFANREESTTIKELADKLVEQLDMVYYHIMQGIEFDDDDEQWIAASRTFLNPTGWMDGGSSYGILLNGYGTAVVNIGRRITDTYGINVKNVEIHNIKVKPYENFWAATYDDTSDESAIAHGFFFETLDWNHGNIYNKGNGYYLGDAYTDILFAANRFLRHDFCPLGSLFFMDGLAKWAFTHKKSIFDPDIGLDFRCGSDIQSHSAKGAIGIRIDGVQDYTLEDIYIHNIVNWGDLGSDDCGEYEQITFEPGVDVDKDIQYGYTGSKVHGILTDYASGTIKNIKIEHLKSWYGSAHGVALYKGSEATLSGYFDINQLIAGNKLTPDQVLSLKLPNPAPFVCSIFIGPNSDSDSYPEYDPQIKTEGSFASLATNIYGYDYCKRTSRVGNMDIVHSPQLFVDIDDNNIIIDGESLFSWKNRYNPSLVLIGLTLFVVILIILCLRKNDRVKDIKGLRGASYGSV